MDLSYFNPHSQNESDFLAGFVARREALDFLLKQLRLAPDGTAARHHLIIAPRGYGKTSLLRRIAIAVRSEDDLKARFIALTFREEQHNVISLDVFWRNCLQSLIEAREDEGADQQELDAIELDWAQHAPRQALGREAQDGEPAWAALRAFCEQLKRRPVLLIDNLDTLLEGLGAQHQWGLRRRLQDANGPLMIAAASRYPATTQDPKAAFYDFFRVQTLDRLNNEQVLACLRSIATHRGPRGQAVLELLNTDPGRVAALNTLAGGNPRTLSVLYSVLESHKSKDLLSQLSAMLDTFTGWYQARTEELPMQGRAVFDALALNWDPMTAAALGQATGLDTSSVSSQLTRLEKAAYVEVVALSSKRKGRSGYQVSERFFNIWYLMRNGPRRARQSIRFLTVFLQSCFSATERRTLARSLLGERNTDPGYTLAIASTLRDGRLRQQMVDLADARSNDLGQAQEYAVLIDGLRNEKQGQRRAASAEQRPTDPEAQINAQDALITKHGDSLDPSLREQVARALVSKGNTLGGLGRSEQAIEAYDQALSRFGAASEPALRERVATALVNKGVTLGSLDLAEQAIEVYDQVLTRFGAASAPALHERVTTALVYKGVMLGRLGRSEQVIEVYDQVLARLGKASKPALRERVATALVNKGIALGSLGRSEQAVEVYDQVLARFGTASEPALRERVAMALVNKGNSLASLDRLEQAIEVYDKVLARIGTANEPALSGGVIRALVNKAITLASLGRSEQAREVFDQVLARLGSASQPALREQVAMALINEAFRLGSLGRLERAIEVFDQVLAHFGTASEPALRERMAMALVSMGVTFVSLGHAEQAIEVFDRALTHFATASEPALRTQLATALVNKATTLGSLGRSHQAVEAFDQVLALLGTAGELSLLEVVAMALFSKGNLLIDFIGDPVAAREAYERGLSISETQTIAALLHAKMAYTLALHLDERLGARSHCVSAVADGESVSAAGRALLDALPIWSDRADPDWARVFDGIGKALTSEVSALWTSHVDDLQRLLWFVLAKGEGERFKAWMEEAQYPIQYAPLYHAFVAAMEGEDHLLQINPETRQPALGIYAGIARLQKLYGPDAAVKGRNSKKRVPS